MRLVSCHVENFGKLSGVDKDFSDGLNCFREDNGCGKSTLASFIKVMFYGFTGEKSRSEIDNERKFFKPWQGGTYGGNLTFEKDGVKYCIYRTFGNKESEDVFKIMNTETGMANHDFEPVPGIALFGIDVDSFERTAYVSQQDCATSVTSNISARIGGVSERDDDMRKYEAADEKLKKECDRLTPDRATGFINKEETELSKLKDQFRNIDSQKALREELETKLTESTEKVASYKEKQDKLRSRLEALRTFLDLREQKANYENLKAAKEKADDDLRTAKSYFDGTIPDSETARKMIQDAEMLRDDEKELASHELTPQEAERFEEETKKFAKSIPSSKAIDNLIRQWNTIQDLKDELPDRREEAEAIKNSALEAQRETYKPFVALLIAGIVVILIAVLLAIFIHPAIGAVAVLGIGAIVFGFILKKKHDDETRSSGEGSFRRYTELMSQIAEDEELVEGTEMDAQDLLGTVGIQLVGRSAMSDLMNLRNQVKEYEALGEKKKRHEEMVKEINFDNRLLEVKEYVKKCAIMGTKASSIPEATAAEICVPVNEISTRVEQIEARTGDAKLAATKVTVFETDHDVTKYEGIVRPEEDTVTVFDLEEALAKSELAQKDDEKELNAYQRELKEADDIYATMEEAKEEYDVRNEKLDAVKLKYETLVKTRECLAAARDSFNTRYIKDIQASFDKYYQILAGNSGDFTIDANLNVTYVEQGQPRVPDTLSEGYQDMVGMCRRVAMADAMYTSEKPFLVLDDPFVNLDDDKLKGASKFISDISEEYQILYFTCQSARAFK
ncbi:MAG: AAA family ATPase [Lachnospiraceae bacterium]|nr:AAA family ATPase [Lachnospiraceae bacterium]